MQLTGFLLLHIFCLGFTLPFSWLLLRFWIAAVLAAKQQISSTKKCLTQFVILVPAHNEELSIAATVSSLKALDYPQEFFEILVIADNCSDSTADCAEKAGAAVLSRFHEVQKSKGYALEFALQFLAARSRPPDSIVIIDADTQVDPWLLRAFHHRLERGQDWIQAYYTVANSEESWRTKLMTYAFALFNGVWLWGQDARGYGCALRGNGMAFSWAGLSRCPWQAHGLTEDLEFSWHLRLAQERVYFAPEARVYGEMLADHPEGMAAQRLRWEHGRKQLRQTFLNPIWRSPRSIAWRITAILDLFMPSLAAYSIRLMLTCLTALLLFYQGFKGEFSVWSSIFIGSALGQVLNFCLYLLTPFYLLKLPLRYLQLLAFSPFYIMWKGCLLAKRAPATWIRTARQSKS